MWVVTPTRQSGRRLRDALVAAAGESGGALFPPRIVTPDYLLTYSFSGMPVAGPEVERAAWVHLLRERDLTTCSALFPTLPPSRSTAWLLSVAEQMIRVRSELVEHGLDFHQVAQRVEHSDFEHARWQALAELEDACEALLGTAGLVDPGRARLRAAQAPTVPESIRHIVVAATPDPAPLVLTVLDNLSAHIQVSYLCVGPDDTDCFDVWGRPLTEVFDKRPIPLEDPVVNILGVADAAAAGRAVVDFVTDGDSDEQAVGVADPELVPRVERALQGHKPPPFNPAGMVWVESELGRLTFALLDLLEEPSLAATTALLRNPRVLRYARNEYRPDQSLEVFSSQILRAWDRLTTRYLPVDLAAAGHACVRAGKSAFVLGPLLECFGQWRAQQKGETMAGSLRRILAALYSDRILQPANPDDRAFLDEVDVLQKCLRAVEDAAAAFADSGRDLLLAVLRVSCAGQSLYPERPAEACDLNGWLELLWEDAPSLIVAGLNDGKVPEAVDGDAFIPERLRVFLGMRTNSFRFARDAYLLGALVALRSGGSGRLELVHCRSTDDGTRLKPSRLFYLAGDDATYLHRVKALFDDCGTTPTPPPRRVAWMLKPPRIEFTGGLSPSKLRDYLRCPFRFYLKHILGWRPHDARKRELDAMDFGSLLHHALEELAQHPDECDQDNIAAMLVQSLHARARSEYGTHISFPLQLQLESAEARLRACASHEAAMRRDGWRTIRVEAEWELDCAGLPLRGRIDRIDALSTSGPYRLIDYKTSDKAVQPQKAHLVNPPKTINETHPVAAEMVPQTAQDKVWVDLQLPLYRLAMGTITDTAQGVETGYFNLPRAAEDCGLALWPELDTPLAESAMECARAISQKIQAGCFWPPSEVDPRYDEFATAFPDGIKATVNPENLQARP